MALLPCPPVHAPSLPASALWGLVGSLAGVALLGLGLSLAGPVAGGAGPTPPVELLPPPPGLCPKVVVGSPAGEAPVAPLTATPATDADSVPPVELTPMAPRVASD
jgi:hypothetical protein